MLSGLLKLYRTGTIFQISLPSSPSHRGQQSPKQSWGPSHACGFSHFHYHVARLVSFTLSLLFLFLYTLMIIDVCTNSFALLSCHLCLVLSSLLLWRADLCLRNLGKLWIMVARQQSLTDLTEPGAAELLKSTAHRNAQVSQRSISNQSWSLNRLPMHKIRWPKGVEDVKFLWTNCFIRSPSGSNQLKVNLCPDQKSGLVPAGSAEGRSNGQLRWRFISPGTWGCLAAILMWWNFVNVSINVKAMQTYGICLRQNCWNPMPPKSCVAYHIWQSYSKMSHQMPSMFQQSLRKYLQLRQDVSAPCSFPGFHQFVSRLFFQPLAANLSRPFGGFVWRRTGSTYGFSTYLSLLNDTD